MTTQPSDWAVAQAVDECMESVNCGLYTGLDLYDWIMERARELDASGGGSEPQGYQCLTEHMPFWGECTHELYEHIRATGYYGKPGKSVKAQARALYAHPPRAAEAGNDFRAALEDLHSSLRIAYAGVPSLPIDESTMDAATDALHAFCLLIGIHKVEVGPYDAAMGAVGSGG